MRRMWIECGGTERVWSHLLALVLTGWLAGLPTWTYGQDAKAEPAGGEEPRTLLAPVNLLPVDPVAETAGSTSRTVAAAPPVRLAPDMAALHDTTTPATASGERIEPASFQEISPGKSSTADLMKHLGEPKSRSQQDDGSEILRFAVGPFPTVRVTVRDELVVSVVIDLASPSTREDVAKELGLDAFRPAVVLDDKQHPLGEVYPERGLMFAYASGTTDGQSALIEHVILETITVEPFLLRAQQPPLDNLGQRLADLKTAQELAPDNAAAFGLAADLQLACGRPQSALKAAEKACELDPDSVSYQIALADARRQLGQATEAQELLKKVLETSDLTSYDHARARLLYGRLLATTAPRDYKRAMEETVSAIKLAAGGLEPTQGAERRKLREVLIDAELSLAEILSYGPWKQKHQVVPQWLATAEKTANELVQKDNGSELSMLDVYNATLHCLLALNGQGTPDKVADAALRLGRDLIAKVDDSEYHAAVEWRLGSGLWLASQIAHRQGAGSSALQFANNADALLESASKSRMEAPVTAYHLGQLQFLTGSIYALYQKDDATAVRWFDKALPHLKTACPDRLADDRRLIGEQMVSIGISLWEVGRRNSAVSVTQDGTDLIATAVNEGHSDKTALSIPYQNLAAMHRELGNTEEADRLARKAADADPSAKEETQRR